MSIHLSPFNRSPGQVRCCSYWLRWSCVLLLGAIWTVVAYAQPDTLKPLFIEADEVVMDQDRGLAVYRGSVRISQNGIRFTADAMTLYSSADGLERVIASGNPVEYREQRPDAPPLVANSGRLDYVVKTGMVILTEDARVQQNYNRLSGERIVYSIAEGSAEAFGDNAAAGGSTNRRIETTILPSAIPRRTTE